MHLDRTADDRFSERLDVGQCVNHARQSSMKRAAVICRVFCGERRIVGNTCIFCRLVPSQKPARFSNFFEKGRELPVGVCCNETHSPDLLTSCKQSTLYLSLNRWIFPVWVLGSSFTNFTDRGYL